MRFVAPLGYDTKKVLRRLHKESKRPRVRDRAHCLLLSEQGYTIPTLCTIFDVTQVTIYNWFNNWEVRGLAGLYDKPGRGRKKKLTVEQQAQVVAWARQSPRNLKKVLALVKAQFGVEVCKQTIQRLLKAVDWSWRRVKRKPRGTPDPQEVAAVQGMIEAFCWGAQYGLVALYYYDESGFSLVPSVPYAWQEKGSTLEIPSGKSKTLNTLGFLSKECGVTAYTLEGTVNSVVVIAAIEAFAREHPDGCPKVIFMDNAPWHTSRAVQAKLPQWRKRGIHIFYLPKYASKLSLIEILWRFMKYSWIEISAYTGWNSLVEAIENILRNYGTEYKINFA